MRIANYVAFGTIGYLMPNTQQLNIYYCCMGILKEQIFYGSYGDLRKNVVLCDGLEKRRVNRLETDSEGILVIGVEQA